MTIIVYKKTLEKDAYITHNTNTGKETIQYYKKLLENETIIDHRILDNGSVVLVVLRGDPSELQKKEESK